MQKNIDILKHENGDKILVHFHGFTSCKEENKNLINYCKKNNISYYGIDFPGQGQSLIDKRDKPTIEYFTKIAINFIKSLNKKNIIISGHSMGGAIAIKVANILGNEIISRILLENPLNFSLLHNEKNRINLLNILKSKSSFLKYDDESLIDFQMDDVHRVWYKNLAEDMCSIEFLTNLENETSKIKIKTDIIYGIDDQIIPYKESLKSFMSIQNYSQFNFHEIKNAKHVPHNDNIDFYLNVVDNLLGD